MVIKQKCILAGLMVILAMLAMQAAVKAEIDFSSIDVNELKNKLPVEFSKTNITLQKFKDMLKDRCISVSGEELGTKAYNEIEAEVMTLAECFSNIVNYTAIQEEIATAAPKGELDVVFNKYCAKKPDVLKCIEAFNDKLTPCADKEEQESQTIFMRMIHKLLDFVCHKGGDQIALFIAEKGPECLSEHKDNIQNCFNSTFSNYMPADGLDSVNSLPKLVLSMEQCKDFRQLEVCIVQHLETCKEITPANIVESLFRFVKNETICRENSRAHRQISGSNSNNQNSLLAILFAMILHISSFLIKYKMN